MQKFEYQRRRSFCEDSFGLAPEIKTPMSQSNSFTFNPGHAILLSPLVLSSQEKPKSRWDPSIKLFELQEIPSIRSIGEQEKEVFSEPDEPEKEDKTKKSSRKISKRQKRKPAKVNPKSQAVNKDSNQPKISTFFQVQKVSEDC